MCAVNFKQLWSDSLQLASVVAKSSRASIYFLIKRLSAIKSAAARKKKRQNDICAQQRHRSAWASPPSLIRLFAVRMKKLWVLSYPFSTQRRLWSDWADAQADLSLRLAHAILLVLSCCGLNDFFVSFSESLGAELKKSSPATIFIFIWAGTRNANYGFFRNYWIL